MMQGTLQYSLNVYNIFFVLNNKFLLCLIYIIVHILGMFVSFITLQN